MGDYFGEPARYPSKNRLIPYWYDPCIPIIFELLCQLNHTQIFTGLLGKWGTFIKVISYDFPSSAFHLTGTSPHPAGKLLSPLTVETAVDEASFIFI